MKCQKCGNDDTKVIRTTRDEDGDEITRHRECKKCGHKFYTYEGADRAPSTCDDSAVLSEIRAAIIWLQPVARNVAVVRDAVKKLERAASFLHI